MLVKNTEHEGDSSHKNVVNYDKAMTNVINSWARLPLNVSLVVIVVDDVVDIFVVVVHPWAAQGKNALPIVGVCCVIQCDCR